MTLMLQFFFKITGHIGQGGVGHTLSGSTSNVDITSATSFVVTLDVSDKIIVNGLMNKGSSHHLL